MSELDKGDKRTPVHRERDDTDESLRVERDTADMRAAEDQNVAQDQADAVVRVARDRADQIVQLARDDADRQRQPQSTATNARAKRKRDRADSILQRERGNADSALDQERVARRRYLADFLAVEREATDSDLIGERVHADTVIAARDEFLATVSHDLRSLLGGLSLNAGLIVKQAPHGAAGDNMRRHAATSQRIVARMSRLLNDLLDIVSMEAGDLALLPEQIEVAEILRETLAAFEGIAAEKHIVLEVVAAPGHLLARLDGGRILQVLANLVSNALKFTPADGRVSIQVEGGKNEIQFSVSDTGVGIPEAELHGVFERFRQVSRDRRGLGLGLHISKGIVEAHGGRMWVESTVGIGSTFHVALPVGLDGEQGQAAVAI